eukprot:TRINITY_DN111264_c0_g1_i1.p1 TRINITY_DN111264_c0_g1~~TRINITY_DN111264_c0_g1_i1.p1  ORF type:complete len:645 (-),score=132.87 TRINITY_DN111264_c0_g1_i1:63-1997(-)
MIDGLDSRFDAGLVLPGKHHQHLAAGSYAFFARGAARRSSPMELEGLRPTSPLLVPRPQSAVEITDLCSDDAFPRSRRRKPLGSRRGLVLSRSLPALKVPPSRRNLNPDTQDFLDLSTREVAALLPQKDEPHRRISIAKIEHRGMMVKQLELLLEFMDASNPGWYDAASGLTLDSQDMSMYQVDYWIIQPLVRRLNCSYVEVVAFSEKAQIPRWFVSHWWGEAVSETVAGVKLHAKTRGPPCCPVVSSYWISAFANAQEEQFLGGDLQETAFFKALCICEGVLFMLDANGPGEVFQRVWCNYEESCTMQDSSHLLLDVIARTEADDGSLQACILTDGLTEEEARQEALAERSPWMQSGWSKKCRREANFPVEALCPGMAIKIAQSRSTLDSDRRQILNHIAGKGYTEDIIASNPVYDQLDRQLRARFACLGLRSAVQQRVDIGVGSQLPLARAIRDDPSRRTLELNLSSCWELSDEALETIAMCITNSGQLRRISFSAASCPRLTSVWPVLSAIGDCRGVQDLHLNFRDCPALGEQTGHDLLHLAKRIASTKGLHRADINFNGSTKVGCLKEAATHFAKAPGLMFFQFIGPDGASIGLPQAPTTHQQRHQVKQQPRPTFESATARQQGKFTKPSAPRPRRLSRA